MPHPALEPRRTARTECVSCAPVDDLDPPVPELLKPAKHGLPQKAVPKPRLAGAWSGFFARARIFRGIGVYCGGS